jgi:N-acetylneuraminic acid mutarotase
VWTFAAPLSVARRPETAVLNGRIFALGGAGTSTVLAIVESYDPVADVWSAEPAMPTARGAGVAAELHGRVHVVSGAVNFSAEITGAHEAFPSHVQLPPAPPPPPPPPPPTLVSISVSPSSATLSQGQTRTFQAIGHYSDGSTRILPSGSGGGGGGNTAPSGPLWSTQFSPQIDVTACGSGQLISFESQVFADANGVVDETWTAMTPLVNVDGSITASAVSLTLACANGAAAGTLSAQWTGTRYEGTFSFNGAWGTVSITGWSRQTPMPESRFSLAAASVDGIVYTFGGGNPSLPSTVYAYTPSTNAWAPAGQMETPREGAGAAAVNGLIYVIGGHVSGGIASGVTEAYDPASHAWITGLTPMPTPRAHLAVVTDGVYVYALGGDTTGSNGGIVAVVERYDPAANTWLTLEPMPSPGSFFAGGVLGGRIVVAGAGANGGISSAVHLYDIAANTWSAGPSMPGGRSMMAAAVANGGLYVVGGNGPSPHETWVYVPATAQRPAGWARAGSILTSRSQLAAAVVSDVVYAIGGMVPGSNPAETFAANEALSTHSADLYMPSSGPSGGGESSSLPSVQWESSHGSVASVNGSGTAHANMPGHTTIIATASNGMSCTASSTCASLTVTDTRPPVIEEVTPSQASLWPPNHQMVPITIAVSVSDNADPAPACMIAGVGSNEPVDGPGDGDTGPDWEVTGALSLRLRAERAGNGSGRIYTIAIRCVDRAGNGSVSGTRVYVAHSLRK